MHMAIDKARRQNLFSAIDHILRCEKRNLRHAACIFDLRNFIPDDQHIFLSQMFRGIYINIFYQLHSVILLSFLKTSSGTTLRLSYYLLKYIFSSTFCLQAFLSADKKACMEKFFLYTPHFTIHSFFVQPVSSCRRIRIRFQLRSGS